MQEVQPEAPQGLERGSQELTQVMLTADQAAINAQAIHLALQNSTAEQIGDAEADLQRLAVFFAAVAADPRRFAVRGEMARSIRTKVRALKGPSQPTRSKNKRKARQEKRMSFHKRRRKQRREMAEAFNRAQQIIEQEAKEAAEAQAELVARLEAEPKYAVTDAYGNVVMGGIPKSMIVPADDEAERAHDYVQNEMALGDDSDTLGTKVILPGSAEALQAQLERSS